MVRKRLVRKKPFKRKMGQNKLGVIKGARRGLKRNFRASRGKEKSISKLMKEADRLFSIKVRMLGAWLKDGEWWNKDYTTGYEAPVKKLHCGHYLSRYYKAARWDYDNCRPQSYMSNIHMRGDPIVFRAKLLKEIGQKRLEAVEAKRHQSIKLSREYLTSLIEELKV